MAAKIEKIALPLPIVISSSVFAARRTDRGVDNLDSNPVFGAANFMIAGGQTLKGIRAAKEVAIATEPSAAKSIEAISKSVENVSKSSKALKGCGIIFDFISRHVNPIICCASLLKILFGPDDKVETGLEEIAGLGGMFLFEKGAKELTGMPYIKKINGKMVSCPREALYHKNPFAEKQVNAFKDYCATKKLFNKISLKSAPAIMKGLFFVCASISGYALFNKTMTNLIEKRKNNTTNTVQMNNQEYSYASAA